MEQMKSSEVFEDDSQLSGAKDPASSLSAPPSTCHSPFATPAPLSPSHSPGPETRLPVVQDAAAAAARKRSSTFSRIREQVRRMVKEKLNVKKGRGGGGGGRRRRRETMLRELFGMGEEERVVETCECSLSTTRGPILGHLFISTDKLAFCSQRPIALHSSTHGIISTPYKVCIPLNMIQEANQTESTTNPAQRFLKIVTHDNHDFWFMLFLTSSSSSSTKHLIALQNALSNSISSASSP